VKQHTARIAILVLLMAPTFGWALDHDNLDPNRPIAIEDAYVLPKAKSGWKEGWSPMTANKVQADSPFSLK